MGEPLSPDCVFDFPIDEPHPAYNFFAPALLPRYAGNPNNNNGWLAADDYLLGELEDMVDEQAGCFFCDLRLRKMDAPMIDIEEDLAVLFGDDDFEDDALDGFGEEEVWEVALGLPVHPCMIEDLSTRLDNLEYGHGQLVQRVIQGSDEEIAVGVTIGAIGLRVLAVDGKMQVMASQMIQVVDRVEQVDVQQSDTQIQQLQTTITEMSSRESMLMRCILGLEKWIAALERKPPGP
ncbi:hypothetical protein Tco_1455201 [Tanacetum coccineum]